MIDPRDTVEYSLPGSQSKLVQRDTLEERAVSGEPRQLGDFQLLRPIGSGGMSLVFEAIDTRRGQRVALKMLYAHGPSAIRRIKREFRVLTNMHHINLVQLYELVVDDEQPFFTMELVEGTSIVEYLRVDGELVYTRLEPTLRQLVDAVSVLHAAGVVHRDLKPSNILVQPDGRVVVLDFGLARALAEESGGLGSGTPAYMAPERLFGNVSTEPSDWFSVGVILHEILTGRLPSTTLPDSLLTFAAATGSSSFDFGVLCKELLAADASQRPRGAQLRALFALPPAPEVSSLVPLRAADGLLVGREVESAWLADAYAQACGGEIVVAQVHGEPGIGKTTLVKRFLGSLQAREQVLVLESRCYEHELVPFNAVDGLIDAVARHIESSRDRGQRVHIPEGAVELGRVFPALATALEVQAEAAALRLSNDPQRLLERAFDALCALLRQLSTEQTIVIHLDDLQWGDTDSAQALTQMVQALADIRLLLIASYRTADAEQSACVRGLRGTHDRMARWQLELGRLPETTALELARDLAGDELDDDRLRVLARESAGSPLFLRALTQYHSVRETSETPTLQGLLCTALERLPTPTRIVLELASLAARPLPQEVLLRAADSGADDSVCADRLIALQRSGLLRAVTETRGALIDTYHDRVREIVAATIDAKTRQLHHYRLASAEALSREPDPEFLAYQFERAGKMDAAAKYAELAGDRAISSVALDRAAHFYELALQCLQGQRPVALLEKLANASAYAGRCVRAAPLYLEAANAVESDQARARRLLLRASEMLLRRGKVQECIATVRPLLRALGIGYPTFAPAAALSIAMDMLRLRLGRARFVPRTRRSATDADKLRHELCFVLGYRLTLVDPLPGSALLLRGLALTLRSGTEAEVARALACYAWILATLGWTSKDEQDRLLAHANHLSGDLESPEAKGWTLYCHGMTLYTRGHFHHALELLEQAHAWVAAKCTDSGWLLAEIELFICAQHVAKGEVAMLKAASEPILRRLNDSGNEFQLAALGALRSQIKLAANEPEAALHDLNDILTTWTSYATAIITVWSKINTLMYQGLPEAAWQTMREHWPAFGRAGYKRVNPWSVALPLLECTVALACASERPSDRNKYLGYVRRGIRWLKRQKADWARPSWQLLQAGLLQLQGDPTAAAHFYDMSAQGYEQLELFGYANIARMRQSELTDDEHAAGLRDQAERWFAAQGILQPSSWMRMYAPVQPGCP